MATRKPVSTAYLKDLQEDMAAAELEFQDAKNELYRWTAVAKLGQPEFEMARKKCLDTLTKINGIQSEMNRVKKAL